MEKEDRQVPPQNTHTKTREYGRMNTGSPKLVSQAEARVWGALHEAWVPEVQNPKERLPSTYSVVVVSSSEM